jgi:glycosyltransferase involved in cell wall biosynthesis
MPVLPPVPNPVLRRVLVLAYYFPPMGMSGVQRVAKLVKYLPEFGWEPCVVTAEPGAYFAHDPGLLGEVEAAGVRVEATRSVDPTRLFGGGRTVALPSEGKRSVLSAISQTVFLPDNKIGWLPFAMRRAQRLHRRLGFDAVFSSAPPYSSHLAAARLAKRWRVPLVVDFRDDWVENPRHVYPTSAHRALHERLERRVLRASDLALTINPVIQRSLARSEPSADVRVLSQGFDLADFARSPSEEFGGEAVPPGERFRLTYTGVFYDAQRPDFFLRAAAAFLARRPEARSATILTFAGLLPEYAFALAGECGLSEQLDFRGYLSHTEATALMQDSAALWLTVGERPGAESISTGKLYDYIGAARPILALVPEGAARDELTGHGAAFLAEPTDVSAISSAIERLYDAWRTGSLPVPSESYRARFDRREIARKAAAMLSELCDSSYSSPR